MQTYSMQNGHTKTICFGDTYWLCKPVYNIQKYRSKIEHLFGCTKKNKKNTPKLHSICNIACDAIFMRLANSLLKTTAILTIGHVIMHTSLYCEDLLCLIYFTA